MPADKNRVIVEKKGDSNIGAALSNKNKPPIQKQTRPVGRPKTGKSSNIDFKQTSVYLKKETLKAAKQKLFDSGEDLSDRLETLLAEWVSSD